MIEISKRWCLDEPKKCWSENQPADYVESLVTSLIRLTIKRDA